jgi:site-specific recombinase XerD
VCPANGAANFREEFSGAEFRAQMASKFLRRQTWWLKLRHPGTGALIRHSLDTADSARAELLRQRIEIEAALLQPSIKDIEIPGTLRTRLGLVPPPTGFVAEPKPVTAVSNPPIVVPARRTTVDGAVAAYLRYIAAENAELHIANKVSMLRRFIGASRVEKLGGPARVKRLRAKDGNGHAPEPPPFFEGEFLDEITAVIVQDFLDGLQVGKKTKRHYREFFHHFFEVCMKLGFYHPTNIRYPNPIGALPSYMKRNRGIVFLKQDEIDTVLTLLAPNPAFRIAAAIMIYAGLRRTEALWLTKDSIAADRSYLSVVYRKDEEADLENSLKTGERAVTILPPLRKILDEYLSTLQGDWVIPNPKGKRWRPDSFTKQLSRILRGAKHPWTCLHFRHTYATQRAAEGWPLFRIAKEMGNSVAVVEEYYAGYIRPDSLGN